MKDYVKYEFQATWFNVVWTEAVMEKLDKENDAASWDYVNHLNRMACKKYSFLANRRPELATNKNLIANIYTDGIRHAKKCLKANDFILEPLTA